MNTKTPLFTPLRDNVLVKQLAAEEKLKGNLIIPDSAKQKQKIGQVVAVGPGTRNKEGVLEPTPVQVGDKVLMDKYAGQEVKLDDEEFVIVKSEDIIAIIN